jgi:hypothetical protein
MTSEPVAALLARGKRMARWSGWQQRTNHAGHLIAIAELTELDATTVPGVTMQLEVKQAAPIVSCLFLFSVMRLQPRIGRRRIYQLEVAPAAKRTHIGAAGVIYGPHEHVDGQREPTAIVDAAVNCDSWDACLLWFFARAGIVPQEIPNPLES